MRAPQLPSRWTNLDSTTDAATQSASAAITRLALLSPRLDRLRMNELAETILYSKSGLPASSTAWSKPVSSRRHSPRYARPSRETVGVRDWRNRRARRWVYDSVVKCQLRSLMSDPTCVVVDSGGIYTGAQEFDYFEGISAQSIGARGLCMSRLEIPPGPGAPAPTRASRDGDLRLPRTRRDALRPGTA
jgi:hypothetical protein